MTHQRRGSRRLPVLLVGGQGGRFGLFHAETTDDLCDWPCTFWGPDKAQVLMGRITDPTPDYRQAPWVAPVAGAEHDLLVQWLEARRYMDQARVVLDRLTGSGQLADSEQLPSIKGLPEIPLDAGRALRVDLEHHLTWEVTKDDRGNLLTAHLLSRSPDVGEAGMAFAAGLIGTTTLEAQLAALPLL